MDDSEIAALYRVAAEQGNANAQFNLGYCYETGRGVHQDHHSAAKWYRKAAEQGHATAQFNLAVCYRDGEGVPQNQFEAANWYQKSAELGDANAQFNLGCCYYCGTGVPQDHAKAATWYRKSAEQGDADAQSNLASCYMNAVGVSQDFSEAVKWYRKAAEQGHADAQYGLGVCYMNGQGVHQDHRAAANCYRKAAKQRHAAAQFNLGVCYWKGEGVPQDDTKAVLLWRKAAKQGLAVAQEQLDLLDQGDTADEDEEKDGPTLLSRGCKAYESGELVDAVALFTRAMMAYEDHEEGRYRSVYHRGRAYMNLRDWDSAAQDFTHAADLWSDDVRDRMEEIYVFFNGRAELIHIADVYLCRGLSYHGNNDYRNAIKDYSQVLDTQPKPPDQDAPWVIDWGCNATCLLALYNRGTAYLQAHNRGAGYRKTGDLNNCVADLEKAHTIDDDEQSDTHWMIHNNLGEAYLKKGLLDKAIEHCSEAIRLQPTNDESYDFRASAYEAKGPQWSEQVKADRLKAEKARRKRGV